MFSFIYKNTDISHSPSMAIISISIILFSGFLLTRITKKLKIPNVTAYIVAGILIGPFCLNLVPEMIIDATAFLPDIALAFIAFNAGQFFKLTTLKKNAAPVVIITVFESLAASLFVFITVYFVLHLELGFSIVLASLAAATAPASTLMTIRQTGAKGHFVETLLQVVALDDVVGLLAYSVAISLALYLHSHESLSVLRMMLPIFTNAAVMALGAFFGFIMKLMIASRHSSDNRLIIAIALLFAFCGVCVIFDISPLLGCMTMGMTYINITNDDKLFKQLAYFSPPILLIFFVRSGMSFNIKMLVHASVSIGNTPLLVVSVLYFFVRIAGKYGGAFLGCLLAKEPKEIRNYLGLALIPQAGVAIGLSALGARMLGGEAGAVLQTVILASSVLYELIGPGCAKLSLYLSHSYSTKLEDLVSVPETTPDGKEKNQLELLIERIQKIQEELPVHTINEEEAAYTEAAENYFFSQHENMHAKNTLRTRRKRK